MDSKPDPIQPDNAQPAAQGPRRRIGLMIAIALGVLFLLFEAGSRLWLAYGKHIPMGRPDSLVLSYYPEMTKAMTTKIGRSDKHFDVLILSGSALFKYYGGPALQLQRALEAAGYKNVRIWNMAKPAHGTRDSLIKYRWLKDKRFDWVIVYHGINDLRANNVPKSEFRDDYSHMAWYSEVNAMIGKPDDDFLAAPLFWNYLRLQLHNKRHPSSIQFDQPPSQEAMQYGSEIRTAEAFRGNLSDIVEISKKRHDWLTLVTYASYLDPKYTLERMKHDQDIKLKKTKGELELSYATTSYADQAQPCEIWGKPENLVKGLKLHNDATRAVARKKHCGLVDFAAKAPQDGKYFIDICHLSPLGVADLTSAVLAQAPPLKDKPAAPGAAKGAQPAAAAGATSATTATQPAANKK